MSSPEAVVVSITPSQSERKPICLWSRSSTWLFHRPASLESPFPRWEGLSPFLLDAVQRVSNGLLCERRQSEPRRPEDRIPRPLDEIRRQVKRDTLLLHLSWLCGRSLLHGDNRIQRIHSDRASFGLRHGLLPAPQENLDVNTPVLSLYVYTFVFYGPKERSSSASAR